jgi:ubiquitin-protein ligase
MMATAHPPIHPHSGTPDQSLLVLLAVLVFTIAAFFVVTGKRKRIDVVSPPSEEELRFIREQRTKTISNRSVNSNDRQGGDRKLKEERSPTLVIKKVNESVLPQSIATVEETGSIKRGATEDENERGAIVDIHKREEETSWPINETNNVEEEVTTLEAMKTDDEGCTIIKKPAVVQETHIKLTEKMKNEKKQSRFLIEPKKAAVEPTALKDPPPVKKRPRKTLARPQLLSDVLSSITKLQVVIHSNDKDYRPRRSGSSACEIHKVTLAHDNAKLETLPDLPKIFRDTAHWFARAHATSRNGFPPHITKPTDDGYDDFQLMLSNLMDQLAQQSLKWLQSDETSLHDDDEEEDDDLFTDYARPALQEQQESGPILAFLALLEETPSPVGRPFLNHLLKNETDVASTLLHRALLRLDSPPSSHLIPKRVAAVSVLLSSPILVQAWTKRVKIEASSNDKNGKEMEAMSWLRPLLQACAYCIPEVGTEQATTEASRYRKELEQLDNFPVCIYDGNNKEVGMSMQQTHLQMQSARNIAETFMRKGGKQNIFQWLSRILQTNDAITSLLQGDLLASNGVTSVLASRSFLLGLASSVVGMCCESLVDLFARDGNAFDHRYLMHHRLNVSDDELMMVRGTGTVNKSSATEQDIKFSGGTEFFFLTCGLLRVSLYPAMRIEGAFMRHYDRVLDSVRQASKDDKTLSPQGMTVAKPVVSALMGWRTFLDDPNFVTAMTKFAILQLQWVLTQKDHFEVVPEWMIKNPATWLSAVAHRPQLLKPYQAIATIECATQLLQVGNKTNGALSPVVIDILVKIIAAFVNAGVNNARQRQRSRGGDFEDDRDSSMYLSFNQNDLGVTVFSNELVSKELCPTLMQTFGAVDVVEGLDVDREHGFDKFSAKRTIAELFLRLWSHPNGECRASVVSMDGARIAQFAKEIEVAIGVLFDFSFNRLADICNGSKRGYQSAHDRAFLAGQGQAAANELYYARLWIMLLCKISEEPIIQHILGTSSVSEDLASLMIHFVDILTDPDGGVHPDLDFSPTRSSDLSSRVDSMANIEKQKNASVFIKSRFLSRVVYGLDVSTLSYQFMALLACWHKQARDQEGCSPILTAFAAHDDYEEHRYRNIARRLIADRVATQGTEGDCAATILEHDGYVDISAWEHNYNESIDITPGIESQMRTAKKDQMTREQIQVLASVSSISAFLDDAEAFKAQSMKASASVPTIAADKLDDAVEAILSSEYEATLESYSDKLSDWIVTSESFENKHAAGTFAHYYDTTARARSVVCSGKTMVKEARRCHKNLPIPHPNSGVFSCFAEERMDLCRACITGPVDSPYAHGIFVFEVFFPANYPTIPPLVTFMTTGGGQTRFNPNLYSDGKVCLSLLGTFHAQDETQKWNPGYSSLAQVLLSIQTQLLVEEPYFNEPGNEARRGTPVGTESAIRYNLVLQLATLRHAILAQLKDPPMGLEEICLRHFGLCRRRIVVQARRWMLEAKKSKSTLYPRFERAYLELATILAAKFTNGSPSLPPCESDVEALEKLNAPMKGVSEKKERAKPRVIPRRVRLDPTPQVIAPQEEVTEMSLAAAFMTAASVLTENPWASPAAAAQATKSDTTDDDDELYD